MSLNTDQSSAVDWTVTNVLEQREQFMTIVGPGGTGKTYCIMHAAQRMLDAGLKVLFTAPTNKAVKQLEKAAREFGLTLDNVAFMTVHSALGLAMLPNEDRKFAVKAGKGFVELFDVIIVDEISMLSRIALFEHLVPECLAHKTPLVGMGDDMQLPPPLEKVSAAFEEFPQFKLTVNERQKEGELLTVNGMLRLAIEAEKPFKAPPATGENITVIPDAKFLRTVTEHFDRDTDLDAQRVIAWSNRRVNQINQAIRHKIYGKDCARFIEGERVMTAAPVKNNEGDIELGTREECLITHVNPDSSIYDDESGSEYRTVQLVLDPLYLNQQNVVEVLHEDEEDRYQEQLEEMAKAAKSDPVHGRQLWKKFWKFKELFADIRHCYAVTAHGAQGSTFDIVFVDLKDMLRNTKRPERQRLIYVGYSRPRHRLFINKRKYVA